MNRLENWLIDWDIYGQPITVQYRGSDTLKTRMGALCTLITYILLLINMIALIKAFSTQSNREESAQNLWFDSFKAGQFKFSENAFSLRIGSFVPIKDRFGRLVINQATKGGVESEEVPLEVCDPETQEEIRNFWRLRVDDETLPYIDDLSLGCPDTSKMFVEG
mmetsp:Transcript_12736/g.17156  ORF Transcript_12736/g.17156 Transcript_12736/m.17156 type:complete len:164 (-) Transcript_12736:1228-1719(-)